MKEVPTEKRQASLARKEQLITLPRLDYPFVQRLLKTSPTHSQKYTL